MVQHRRDLLDTTFAALSDATRRSVIERLQNSDASVTDLALAFRMTLTGMKKHISLLETAGFVATEKVGRVRICRLGSNPMAEEAAWIARYRKLWATRFDALDVVVEDLKRKEQGDAAGPGK